MRTTALLGLLLVAAGLAGCLTDSDTSTTVDPQQAQASVYDAIEAAIGAPIVDDHDHLDAALHQSHYNLQRVALDGGNAGAAAQPTESYLETAVKGGYAYLCRTGPNEGLVIFDVHDIEHPKQVGYLHLDAGFEADVEVSDDGHWAFWETQRFPTSAGLPNPTEPGANLPHGIHIVDISDKANPKWVGFQPVTPDGPHSITYANVTGPDGVHHDIVFASTYAFLYAYEGVNVPTTQREILYELVPGTIPGQMALRNLYEFTDPNAGQMSPTDRGGAFPHDVTVAVHPVTHRTYAYIAYWDLGVVVLDVTDVYHPVKVGQAIDFGPAPTREIHMARQSEALIDGKVVVVAEPEIGGQDTTGYMTMLDATDPSHITYLSSWKIPGNATSAGGGLGPHYFDLKDGRVAMASYHAGFWVFDIHDHANLLHPRTVAFAQVNATGSQSLPGPLGIFGGADSAFDAWWADPTHVVGGDVNGGLAVYRYLGPAPAIDAPATADSVA